MRQSANRNTFLNPDLGGGHTRRLQGDSKTVDSTDPQATPLVLPPKSLTRPPALYNV